MNEIRRSFALSLTQNYIVLGLQFISSVIIARLLTPAEIGVFSVSMVFIGFAYSVRDFGVEGYIIQEKDLSNDRIRTALGVTICFGWATAAVVFALSFAVSAFYQTAGIEQVMQVLACNFVLIPFGAIPFALLLRKQDFVPIYKTKVLSALVSSVTAVSLALEGFTYLSLALAAAASNVTMIVMAIVYRPAGLPYLPHFRDLRRVLRFGAGATTALILADIDKGAPDLILGRLMNMSAVGYFGRAAGLVQLFDRLVMNSVWPVALPYFSAEARAGAAVRTPYLKSISYLTAIAWPFAVFLGAMAFPVIRLLFGPQWDESISITRWLALDLAVDCPFILTGSVLIALGQLRRLVRTSAVIVTFKILILLLASTISLEAVAIGVVATSVVAAVAFFRVMKRIIGFEAHEFLESMRLSAWVSICSAVGPLALIVFWPPDPNHLALYLLIAASLTGAGWLMGIVWFKHPLVAELTHVLARGRRVLRRAKEDR